VSTNMKPPTTPADWYRKGEELKKKAEEWKKRFDQARDLLDEEKRPATLFDLAQEWLPKIIDRLFKPETPLTRHPLWEYHKPHFKAMRHVLVVGPLARAAEGRGKEATALVKELELQGTDVLSVFAVNGAKWQALLWTAQQRRMAVGSYRSVMEFYGPIRGFLSPEGQQLRIRIDAFWREQESRFQELFSQWAALRMVEGRIAQLVGERNQRLDAMKDEWLIGRLGSDSLRNEDQLERLDHPMSPETLIARAAITTNKVWRLVLIWADEIDRWRRETRE